VTVTKHRYLYINKSFSDLLINRNRCKTDSKLIFPTSEVPLFIKIFMRVGGRSISHLAIYLPIDRSEWHALSQFSACSI